MSTLAEILDAHKEAQAHRFRLRTLVRADGAKVTPEEQVLVERLRAAGTPADYDQLLASKDVNAMFVRGAAYFGGTP